MPAVDFFFVAAGAAVGSSR